MIWEEMVRNHFIIEWRSAEAAAVWLPLRFLAWKHEQLH